MTHATLNRMIARTEDELKDVREQLESVEVESVAEAEMIYVEAKLEYKVNMLYGIRDDYDE